MTYLGARRTRLTQPLCRYGTAHRLFRGPEADLNRAYIACLGGAGTFGKGVSMPFPALVSQALGVPVVNLGQPNAGVGSFLEDRFISTSVMQAELTVIEVTGAANISNIYYHVHPRHNDRLVEITPSLRALFPGVDFADIHYTRHLLHSLQGLGPQGFAQVQETLQHLWVQCMMLLMANLAGPSIVLWVSDRAPPSVPTHQAPIFVTAKMMDQIAPFADAVIEVVLPKTLQEGHPDMHQKIAGQLLNVLQPLTKKWPAMMAGHVMRRA